MNETIYNQLQLREVFHLEFLRALGRKIKPENYALKGGVNLRFFFNSIRYSEDMDLDVSGIKVYALSEIVMKILGSPSFGDTLRPFGIDKIAAPDISKAKQTKTTQRFKVHLLTGSGEDLFTKVEFSRRGFKGAAAAETVSENILRSYRLTPLLCPHYSADTAAFQKVEALAMRSATQARDVFDLFILIPQTRVIACGRSSSVIARSEATKQSETSLSKSTLNKAKKNALEISFEQFRDTVVSYLLPEDRPTYEKAAAWDEIKLKVSHFLEKMREGNA